MTHHHCTALQRAARLLLAFTIALLSGLAAVPVQAAPAALERSIEPVVVAGVFPGAPVDEVFVYKFTAADGWQQIVFQVDERTGTGQYTASEDGVMDINDEVVFMVGDLGEQATVPISETLQVDERAIYEVSVSDPRTPGDQGFAYLVTSDVLTPAALTPYIQGFEATDQVITAQNYTIGWAEDFAGLDYLALFGGPDILDRTKLRLEASAGPLSLDCDETLACVENFVDDFDYSQEIVLDKIGPVRAIVHTGQGPFSATTFAYGSYMETTTHLDIGPILDAIEEEFGIRPDISIDSVRFSTDLRASATPATYYDENMPTGAVIDGSPDAVPASPFIQGWRQVSHSSGTTVQVLTAEGVTAGTIQHYYADNSSAGGDAAIGDDAVYGDSGLIMRNVQGEVFTFQSAQYFLEGSRPNVGAIWYGYSQTPLAVRTSNLAARHIYLPNVIKPE